MPWHSVQIPIAVSHACLAGGRRLSDRRPRPNLFARQQCESPSAWTRSGGRTPVANCCGSARCGEAPPAGRYLGAGGRQTAVPAKARSTSGAARSQSRSRSTRRTALSLWRPPPAAQRRRRLLDHLRRSTAGTIAEQLKQGTVRVTHAMRWKGGDEKAQKRTWRAPGVPAAGGRWPPGTTASGGTVGFSNRVRHAAGQGGSATQLRPHRPAGKACVRVVVQITLSTCVLNLNRQPLRLPTSGNLR